MAKSNKYEENLLYLQEHISYERVMLGYTIGKLETTTSQMDWNAYYESFCIHARNLYRFLRNDGQKQNTFVAGDYVKNWSKPDHDSLFNNLDNFVFHLTHNRLVKEKPNLENLQRIGRWIDQNWSLFYKNLNEPYKNSVLSNPVCTNK